MNNKCDGRDVDIIILRKQNSENEKDIYHGHLKTLNNRLYIQFADFHIDDDGAQAGDESCTHLLKISHERMEWVKIYTQHEKQIRSYAIFEEGKKHPFCLITPYGGIDMSIDTHIYKVLNLKMPLTPDISNDLEIDLIYTIYQGDCSLSDYEVNISIKKTE